MYISSYLPSPLAAIEISDIVAVAHVGVRAGAVAHVGVRAGAVAHVGVRAGLLEKSKQQSVK